jgi:hypothetical protein
MAWSRLGPTSDHPILSALWPDPAALREADAEFTDSEGGGF